MGKMDNSIVCINRSDLFVRDEFEGFVPAAGTPFSDRISRKFHARRRGDVEQDPSVKQLIGYALIVHESTKSVFAFQRSVDDSKYGEKRLMGKWSWGVGGHTELGDDIANPVESALRRELAEEVGLVDGYSLRVLGYINDDRDSVGSVHFGVVYLVSVGNPTLSPADGEMSSGGFVTLQELSSIMRDCPVESWSAIAHPPLADVLEGRAVVASVLRTSKVL